MGLRNIFSVSNIATVLVCFYTYASMKSIYNLMYPLNAVDVDSFPLNRLVKPYWKKQKKDSTASMGIKVYLSTSSKFTIDFLIDEYAQKISHNEELPPKKRPEHDTVLLLEEPFISSSSLANRL